MTTEARQVLSARAQGFKQVESGDAATRAAAATLGVEADQHHGHPVALRESRCSDPDHARVPALAGEDQRRRRGQVGWKLAPCPFRPLDHLPLRIAPLTIRLVELAGDRDRPLGVVGEHQLDPGIGAIEAPGGVHPGREPECQVALVEAHRLHSGCLTQRPQTWSPGPSGHRDAGAHQGPVLTGEGDQVGDRRERHQVQVALGPLGPEESGGELVGDPGRAEVGTRISAQPRMEDPAVGEAVAGLVVIGDDHSHPGPASGLDLVGAGDPAVRGDQQAGAPGGDALDSLRGQPVSITEATGDVPVAFRSQLPKRPNQDRGRADAVAVVVAVHGDPESLCDRLPDLLGYLPHALELARVVGLCRIEEGARLVDRPIAATHQGHGDGLGKPELADQRPRLGVGVRLEREAPPGGSLIRGRYGHLMRLRTPGDGTAPRNLESPGASAFARREGTTIAFDVRWRRQPDEEAAWT